MCIRDSPYYTPEIRDLTVADLDIIAIPRGSRHPREAFEFIRFIQRRENMELLCGGQKKHSPLVETSPEFVKNHPHPYLHVFTQLSASPNILGIPKLGCWFEVEREYMHAREQTTELCRLPKVRHREAVLREMRQTSQDADVSERKKGDLLARARALFAPGEIPADLEARLRELKSLGKDHLFEERARNIIAEMKKAASNDALEFSYALKLLGDGQDCYFRMCAQAFLTAANARAQAALERELREKSLRQARDAALFYMFPRPFRAGVIEPWRF